MDHKKVLAMGVGNMLEWYDFAVFGALADVIGEKFFPSQEPNAAFMLSLSVFGSAFLMRPIGGMLMGIIGDTLGRKRALEVSIALMLFPSVIMGTLMPYEMWGRLSTILLIILRLMQGLAVGGELVGAFIFTIENTYGNNRGFWGAICKSSGIWGTAVGMGVVAILRMTLSKEQLLDWGWRVPFLSTLIIGLAGIWLRSFLSESIDFERIRASQLAHPRPLCSTLCQYWLEIALIVLVTAAWCVGYYTCFVWMPFYMSNFVGASGVSGAWLINFLMTLLLVFLLPVAGQTADAIAIRYKDPDCGFRVVMMVGCALMIVLAVPAFVMINYAKWWSAAMGQLLFAIALACHGGNMPGFMVMLLPVDVRYSAIGAGYNLANALFAGTAPLAQTFLVIHERGGHLERIGHIYSGLYLALAAFVSLIALSCLTPYVVARRKRIDDDKLNELLEMNSLGADSDGFRRKIAGGGIGRGLSSIDPSDHSDLNASGSSRMIGRDKAAGKAGAGVRKILPGRAINRFMKDSSGGHEYTLEQTTETDFSTHSETPLSSGPLPPFTANSGYSGHSFHSSNMNNSSVRHVSNPNIQIPVMASFAQSINPMRHSAVVNESFARQEQRRRVSGSGGGLSLSTHSNTTTSSFGSGSGSAHQQVKYPTHSGQRPNNVLTSGSPLRGGGANRAVPGATSGAPPIQRIPSNFMTGQPSGKGVLAQTKGSHTKGHVVFASMPSPAEI